MSQENVEVVRSVFEPLDGIDLAAIDWDIETIREAPEYHVENLDYIEAGVCVLVPSRQWGIGSGSRARAEIKLTTLYEQLLSNQTVWEGGGRFSKGDGSPPFHLSLGAPSFHMGVGTLLGS